MKWLRFGIRFVPAIISAIRSIEQGRDKKGPDKEDAAVELAKVILAATETVIDKDVADDQDVEAAIRGLIRAYVAFQNTVTKVKTVREAIKAAETQPPAPVSS